MNCIAFLLFPPYLQPDGQIVNSAREKNVSFQLSSLATMEAEIKYYFLEPDMFKQCVVQFMQDEI